MTKWVDSIAQTIGHSMTGTVGEENLFSGTPSLPSPWASNWGFPTSSTAPAPTKPKIVTGLPKQRDFALGDGIADTIARSQGVDPYANNDILKLAKTQVGAPYVWADLDPVGPSGGPGAGFDCSGFTKWLYSKAYGIALPHSAASQQQTSQNVDRKNLQPGDLIFYNYGRLGPGIADHVAVYVGNGQQVAASSSASQVTVQGVDWSHFMAGGRFTGAKGTSTTVAPTKTKKAPRTEEALTTPFSQQPHTADELTVPFPTTFGDAIGGIFNGPQPEVAEGSQQGDPAVQLSMSSSTADLKAVALAQVTRRGWSKKDWSALEQLWDRESGWNPNADNPTSTAYGIPQAMMSAHPDMPADYRTNPLTQIQWGLDYIASRYGSPSQAWAHSQRVGWY